MANQSIPGLNSIASPSSAGLLWISDPNASPQDRSFSLVNFFAWIAARLNTLTNAISTTSTLHASGAATLGSALTVAGALVASQTLRAIGTVEADGGVDSGGSGVFLKKKVVNIGDWNMTGPSVNVAHGLTLSKIRGVYGMVRNDTDTAYYPVSAYTLVGSSSPDPSISSVDGTNVVLARTTGGIFNSVNFDSIGYNRGWITIEYIP